MKMLPSCYYHYYTSFFITCCPKNIICKLDALCIMGKFMGFMVILHT